MALSQKHCVACEGWMPPLSKERISALLKQIKKWKVVNGRLHKDFKFKDFKEALRFVNRIGAVAEREGHHPDIYFTWGKCTIELYTHSMKGLSDNDFILAAKIDKIR